GPARSCLRPVPWLALAAPTASCALSLHDALPIWCAPASPGGSGVACDGWSIPGWFWSWPGVWPAVMPGLVLGVSVLRFPTGKNEDRQSTRLNSRHVNIPYAVFCLEKKREEQRGDP